LKRRFFLEKIALHNETEKKNAPAFAEAFVGADDRI